jgi:hypothetical protein
VYRGPCLHAIVALSMATVATVADCEKLAGISPLMLLFPVVLDATIVTTIAGFRRNETGAFRVRAFDEWRHLNPVDDVELERCDFDIQLEFRPALEPMNRIGFGGTAKRAGTPTRPSATQSACLILLQADKKT